LTLVILLYPDSQRREVILSCIPVKGDTILLKGEHTPLVVEHRLLMEAANGAEPVALITVRPAAP
jgi:hypothetical protein